jgi:hypothetical protein
MNRPISSLTEIQLENLREKLEIEQWLTTPRMIERSFPADGADGSQEASPEAK